MSLALSTEVDIGILWSVWDLLVYLGWRLGSMHTRLREAGRTIHDGITHDSALRRRFLTSLLDDVQIFFSVILLIPQVFSVHYRFYPLVVLFSRPGLR
ncbi:hypothetical protein GGR55DRAFT_301271 [Xylaria sp. FL0064]|nr:hypothetical protein GGR55DRAFT_301271 [Xylaria sp. FL0064]